MTNLDHAVAVITGASSGIGRAVALALARQGVMVALGARRMPELQAVVREIEAAGGRALAVETDVEDTAHLHDLVEKARSEWGRLDIVVANAGQYVRAAAEDVTMADIERSIEVNFYGSTRLVLAALPHLLEQRSGHIVLIASLDGKKGLPLDTPYASAKFALVGFGDVMRQELRRFGIGVSTVLPGRVDTPFVESYQFPFISRPIPPGRVASAVISALRRNRAEVVVPRFNILLVWTAALAPRLGDRAVRVLRLEGWRKP